MRYLIYSFSLTGFLVFNVHYKSLPYLCLLQDPHQNPRILRFKKYLKAAGIRVRNYADLWAGCKSDKSRVAKMKELLTKAGIQGKQILKSSPL